MRLKRLSLWGNHNITSGAIDHLTTCPMLEALDLHDTRIAPSTLGRLSDLPHLSRLVFSTEFYHQESSRMNGSVMRDHRFGQVTPWQSTHNDSAWDGRDGVSSPPCQLHLVPQLCSERCQAMELERQPHLEPTEGLG